MIEKDFALKFAEDWINSWNSHDIDVILSHYTEDFTIESPYALKWMPESGGVLNGKPAIKAYWLIALQSIPDLKFELQEVLTGINSITLYYFNPANGKNTAEVMFFNADGKVTKVFAHYN